MKEGKGYLLGRERFCTLVALVRLERQNKFFFFFLSNCGSTHRAPSSDLEKVATDLREVKAELRELTGQLKDVLKRLLSEPRRGGGEREREGVSL